MTQFLRGKKNFTCDTQKNLEELIQMLLLALVMTTPRYHKPGQHAEKYWNLEIKCDKEFSKAFQIC